MNFSLDRYASYGHKPSIGIDDSGRQLPSTASYESSDSIYGESRRTHHPLSWVHVLQRSGVDHASLGAHVSQSAYHPGQSHGYVQTSPPSSPHNQVSAVSGHAWQSPEPSTPTLRTSVGHLDHSSHPTSFSGAYADDGPYQQQPSYGQYGSASYHGPSLLLSHRNVSCAGSTVSFSRQGSGYPAAAHSASIGYATPSSFSSCPQAASPSRCEWAACRLVIEDTSPAGIARHLKQHHNVQVTDNRNRSPCLWGARRCGKDMYPSSYGKHIAECHLRNLGKQCPHCGADFARPDTLSRHIKSFCPNSSG
ncbi:hypothetical protein BD414DRAFT_46704 [Trametes punicea]|nr:hypothetical protein BD414DRAFT_46704 [Trametes punicea]